MSPDEYSGNSSDPPYTTAVAQITLRAALDLAPLVGQQPDESLRAVVRKTPFCSHQLYVKRSVCQDRLGTNMGKVRGKGVFLQADGLRILYDPKLDYHPEHTGYLPNQTIKQADVVMLGYPLAYNISLSSQRNDLAVYANVTGAKQSRFTARTNLSGSHVMKMTVDQDRLGTQKQTNPKSGAVRSHRSGRPRDDVGDPLDCI